MNDRLMVWITLPDGETAAVGELAFGDARADGTAPAAFRYAPSWLDRADAFALNPDPQSLPLDRREFQGSHLGPPLQVFDDALPDDWGRRLIVAEHRLPRSRQRPFEFLRIVAGNGLGALSFAAGDSPPPRTPSAVDLDDLAAAAEDFDAGRPLDDPRLARLYAAGSTPGGARPKARVHHDGGEWLAKFPSVARDQGHDVVGLEALGLRLAALAGLEVPESRLIELAGRRLLLVRRFDIDPAGGRRHMLSLKSLCAERGDRFVQSYDELMAAVRRHADDLTALTALFRHMAFNAALGNTDDHTKNFAFLRDAGGWRLSPAFDLLPDVGRNSEHTLAMGCSHATPSGADLLAIHARWFGCKPGQARDSVERVVGAVASFREEAAAIGVAAHSVDFFAADIERRLAILRQGL